MPRKPTGRPRGRPAGTGILGPETHRLTVRIPTDLYDRLEAFAEGRSFTRGTPELARCVREALEHYLVCPYKRQTQNVPALSQHNMRQTKNERDEREEAEVVPGDNKRQTAIEPSLVESQSRQYTGQLEKSTAPDAEAQEEFLSDRNNTALDDLLSEMTRTDFEAMLFDTTHPALDAVLSDIEGSSRTDRRQPEIHTEAVPAPPFDTSKYTLGELCVHAHDYHGTGHSLRRLADRECLECHAARSRAYRQRKRQAPRS